MLVFGFQYLGYISINLRTENCNLYRTSQILVNNVRQQSRWWSQLRICFHIYWGERLRQLAPADPDLLFRCGVLELSAGRCELAYDTWRRSLTLTPRYLDGILDFVEDHARE